MKKLLLTMAIAAVSLAAAAEANPLLDYKNWKTPHGTYPFNEIKIEHYRPALEQGIKEGLADIDAIVNNKQEPTFANTIEAYVNAGKANHPWRKNMMLRH